uniref:Immunoglobulin superfamily member 10-like n=1 Tax=Phallusia mammillata TaxID=59560 RepID=A0A6F9DFS7_9ASCI|nr:immunoglobulin superfamily member 10-like [Phallusia mammillata]
MNFKFRRCKRIRNMNNTFTKSDASEDEASEEDNDERDDKPIYLQFESNGSSSAEDEEENSATENTANTKVQEKKTTGAKHPPYVQMIPSAITSIADKKGATVRSIKMYIMANHFINDDAKMKRNLRTQLEKGLASGMLIRPKPKKGAKEAIGLQGRFKVHPQWVKKQEKTKKLTLKAKAQKAKKKTTSKTKSPKVDGSNLTSLKDKSYSVRLAQDKIKKARKSLAMSPAVTKVTKKRPTVKKKVDEEGEGEKKVTAKKAKDSKGKSAKTTSSNDEKPKKKAKATTDGTEKATAKKKAPTKITKGKAATKAKPATTKKTTSTKTSKAKETLSLQVHTASEEEVLEGQKAVLRCIYSDEYPTDTLFVVLWQKLDPETAKAATIFNSQNPHDEKHSDGRLKQVGVASLQISPVYKSDAGKYRCQVTPLPSFEQGEAETQLIVTYPPYFQSPTNSTLYIEDDKDVDLPCSAHGLPEQIQYTWYFQNMQPDTSGEVEKIVITEADPRLWYRNGNNLHISGFSQSLEGRFRCEASNDVGVSNSYFYLHLKRPATFIDYPKEPVKVIEGEDVKITVSASAVPNNITFKWFYKGQSIDLFGWSNVFGFEQDQVYPYLRISQFPEKSQLEIKDVTRNVAGMFTCSIFNNFGHISYLNITLEVQYPAFLTLFPAPAYTVVEGTAITLPCGGVGNPIPQIQWRAPGTEKLMSFSTNLEDRRFNVAPDGNLTIFPIIRNDSGMFLCTASNGIDQSDEITANVTILFAPTMTRQPSKSYVVNLGEKLTLNCDTTGLPTPQYTWYKDHVEIDSSSSPFAEVAASSSLHLTNLSHLHTGVYRCQAENRFGMVFAESVVQVQYPPVISMLSSVGRVLVGDHINVTCTVSGHPLPSIEWSHALRSSDVGIASVITNGTRGRTFIITTRLSDSKLMSTLMLSRVGLSDCGLYYCTANSILGSDKGFTELRCMDLPPVPSNIVISRVTDSSFFVAWQLDDHIPNGERFLLEVRLNGDERPFVVPCDVTSCLVTSLNASTVYSVRVFGVNSVGNGNKSAKKSVKTKATKQIDSVTTSKIPFLIPTTEPTYTTSMSTTQAPKPNTSGRPNSVSSSSTFHTPLPTAGIKDIVYNSTDGWVRWRLDSSYENALLSWNSSSLQRCVKIEARSSNSDDWRVVAWCIAAWAEVCSLNLPASASWQVRVNLCWNIDVGCGKPVTAKTVYMETSNHTKTVPTEAIIEGIPIAAVVSATVALVFVVIAYVISYRHFRKRRKKMDDYEEAFELRRPGARLFRHQREDPRARAYQASINYLRASHANPWLQKSRSLPGYMWRREST